MYTVGFADVLVNGGGIPGVRGVIQKGEADE
jgi:hypothetical protein